jgi:hypothetical protein
MAKWRNKIDISNLLTEDESNEQVLIICKVMIPQLETILKKEQELHSRQTKERIRIDVDEDFLREFENIIDEFKWIVEKIENGNDSCLDSWCDEFNEYLEQLYDMGDMLIKIFMGRFILIKDYFGR